MCPRQCGSNYLRLSDCSLYSGTDAQLTFLGDTRSHPVHHCDCRRPHRRLGHAQRRLIRLDQRAMERLKVDLSVDPPD